MHRLRRCSTIIMRTRRQKSDFYFLFTINIFISTLLICGALSNTCTSKLTCGECIAEGPHCAWCWKKDSNFTMCNTIINLKKNCTDADIIAPNSTVKIEQDLPLSNKGVEEEKAIQIKPQKYRIKLRPNEVKKISVEFRQAVDYPVDLYYLMDLSNSMKDDQEKLAGLGDKLADGMKNITKNFKLGFGSFVDKTVAPFVNSHEEKLLEPCTGCASPYGFRNNMPLNSNTKEFAKNVRAAAISGNLDAPEGGFDAIMQAIVCHKEIGWRNDSRKLLVYSSDNSYHYAGDGKLGGLVEPNDETCHLDKDGNYIMSTVLDYPSISQISRQSRNHNVNIIFAVTADQTELYKELSKMIPGHSSTGALDSDSGNVVGLVQDQYEKISTSVVMLDDAKEKNIQLTYKSKCLGTELKETNSCHGLKVETTVKFEIDLEFGFCPSDRAEWNKTFKIYPAGLQERLIVHLEMLCECDCEKPGEEEYNSSICNGNGTYECGICNCNEKRVGKFCECNSSETSNDKDDGCYNENDNYQCSGVGDCRCGKCYCHSRNNPEEKYDGKYCECNNFSCDKKEGKVCSGKDHGVCECGKCKCNKGWKGDDCSCKDSNKGCMDDNGDICSGRGECRCGSCICDSTQGEEFFGAFCDDCATCPGKCSELKECVECRFKNQHGDNLNCSACDDVSVQYADKIEVNDKGKLCAFEDEEKCRYAFNYTLNEDYKLTVFIRSDKECPAPLPVVAIVSGVSGGVVATGLFLLMLWKILTTIHDRRELAKFEKEKLKRKWNQDENPIFVGATSTFQNPAYRGE